jgi:hypothetical protein
MGGCYSSSIPPGHLIIWGEAIPLPKYLGGCHPPASPSTTPLVHTREWYGKICCPIATPTHDHSRYYVCYVVREVRPLCKL